MLNCDGAGHVAVVGHGPSSGRIVTRLHAMPAIDARPVHCKAEHLYGRHAAASCARYQHVQVQRGRRERVPTGVVVDDGDDDLLTGRSREVGRRDSARKMMTPIRTRL